MKRILIILLSVFCFQSFSQTEKVVLGSFTNGCSTYNYEFKKGSNGLYSFKINSAFSKEEKKEVAVLNVFERESFESTCTTMLNSLFSKSGECPSKIKTETLAKEAFHRIKAQFELQDDEPVTSVLRLKSKYIKCYSIPNIKNPKVSSLGKHYRVKNYFEVKRVNVEFEDGTIKNILCDLQLLDSLKKPIYGYRFTFKNFIPISISGRNDKDLFDNHYLYVGSNGLTGNDIDWYKTDKPKQEKKEGEVEKKETSNKNYIEPESEEFYLGSKCGNLSNCENGEWGFNFTLLTFALSDIIYFEDYLESGKEDYSPANQEITLDSNTTFKQLKKEARSKILELNVFSDFVGVSGDQPNGLIQIEASKKFNLITKRKGKKSSYSGTLTYIKPKLTFSKIEDNNSVLFFGVSNFDSTTNSINTTAIDLLKYQASSFDIDFNLYKINYPALKSNFEFNVYGGFLRTDAADSLNTKSDSSLFMTELSTSTLNTFRYGGSVMWNITPDSRYGIQFGYAISNYSLLSDRYILPEGKLSIMQTVWAEAFLKTSDNAKLFFRYRFSFSSPVDTHNFAQIQIGYNMNLFKAN